MRDPTMGRRLSYAIRTWATTIPHGCRAGGTVGGFSFIQLHTRPDPRAPEVQLTLRAAIVDGQPVIQVPELEAGRENQAEAAPPSATGAFVVAPIEAHRFCRACWPEQSVTLHGTLELVETIERARTLAAAALCLPMES